MIFSNKLNKGRQAEDKACQFLQKKGLNFLKKNYRSPFGEVDLIMQTKSMLIFIEVRSRQSSRFGSALESINTKKTKRIIKTAKHFLQKHGGLDKMISRFDIVTVNLLHPLQIEWIQNAFAMNDSFAF